MKTLILAVVIGLVGFCYNVNAVRQSAMDIRVAHANQIERAINAY